MATNTSFTNPQSSKLVESKSFVSKNAVLLPLYPVVQESNFYHLRLDVVRGNWPVCLLFDSEILIRHTILPNFPNLLDWPRCTDYS